MARLSDAASERQGGIARSGLRRAGRLVKLYFPEGEIDFVVSGPLTADPTVTENLFRRIYGRLKPPVLSGAESQRALRHLAPDQTKERRQRLVLRALARRRCLPVMLLRLLAAMVIELVALNRLLDLFRGHGGRGPVFLTASLCVVAAGPLALARLRGGLRRALPHPLAMLAPSPRGRG